MEPETSSARWAAKVGEIWDAAPVVSKALVAEAVLEQAFATAQVQKEWVDVTDKLP